MEKHLPHQHTISVSVLAFWPVLLLLIGLTLLAKNAPSATAAGHTQPPSHRPLIISPESLAGPACFATHDNGTTLFSSIDAQAVQDAINVASPDGTVKIAGTCVGVTTTAGTEQTGYISKTLTLRGGYTTTNWTTSDPTINPTTLDAAQGGRVLYLTGPISVTVENLSLTGGSADLGGGIFNTAATTAISNTQVYSNSATDRGGGLWNETAGRITLHASEVTSNTAGPGGGGIYSNGAGTVFSIVGGSRVAHNAAIGDGGGIYNVDAGHLSIVASDVVSNTAGGYGGGIVNWQSGVLTVTSGSRVEENRANNGGGIWSGMNGSSAIVNSRILSNTAVASGGGIFQDEAGSVIIDASSIVFNSASSGGGIYSTDSGSTVALDNDSRVQNNQVTGDGGGIFNTSKSRMTIDASLVASNTSGGDGGGVVNWTNSVITITNGSRIEENQANVGAGVWNGAFSRAVIEQSQVLSNTAAGDGGGIYSYDHSDVSIDASSVVFNTSGGDGGGVTNWVNATLTVTNGSLIQANTANRGGGVWNGTNSTATITNSALLSNTAGSAAGALYQEDNSTSSITASCVVGNSDTAVAYASGTSPITATGNWWGHSSGPSGAGLGVGDSVSSDVNFSGFLGAAILGCPIFGDPDLAIIKSASASEVLPGQPVTFTLAFTNTGNHFAHRVVISDSVPVSVTIDAVTTSTVSDGVSIVQTSGSPNFAWGVDRLPVGAGGMITLTGSLIDSGALFSSQLTNTVVISAVGDLTLGNNSSRVLLTVPGPPVLTIDKRANVNFPGESTTITYTIIVSNTGVSTAPGVTIDDTLAGVLGSDISLAAGETVTFTYTHWEDDGPLTVVNTATVASRYTAGVSSAVTVEWQNIAPTATLSNSGPVDEGAAAIISFSNQYDPSIADKVDGYRYSYDFDNDGKFEVNSSNATTAIVFSNYLTGLTERTVLARIADKDGGFTDYTTVIAIKGPEVPDQKTFLPTVAR